MPVAMRPHAGRDDRARASRRAAVKRARLERRVHRGLRQVDAERACLAHRADLGVVFARPLGVAARDDRAAGVDDAQPTHGLSPVLPRARSASAIATRMCCS